MEVQSPFDRRPRVWRVVIGPQIDLLALHQPPQPFDKHAVRPGMAQLIARDAASMHDTQALLDRLAGGNFAGLPKAEQEQVCDKLPAGGGVDHMLITRIVPQRHDHRVMTSLGMEPRHPFPKGHDLPTGDQTLLDTVPKGGKTSREV